MKLASLTDLKLADDPYEAACASDAVVLITPWEDYRQLDFTRLKQTMRRPFVLDTASLWDHSTVQAAGMLHWDIGRGRSAKKKTAGTTSL